MADTRYTQLAEVITYHSLKVKEGDKVLIEAFDLPDEFTVVLIRTIAAAGGIPLCEIKHNRVLRELYLNASEEQMRLWGEIEKSRMERVQCYVGMRGTVNSTELSDVSTEKFGLYHEHLWTPVHTEIRVKKTRWVVLRWPSPSMAQQARMSTEAFEEFYFQVCTVDYGAMADAMQPLVKRMEAADRVRIVGPGTDLRFSIAGIPAIGCAGEMNIPDGEVFTSPVRDSVQGTLSVNTSSLYEGTLYENIRLEFVDGKITSASANHAKRFNELLDADEGARHIGEFAIGFNPRIQHPMMDILFDEKIAGSFHFTPGQAYEEADNGNRSKIHWDLVTIQRSDYGGGEIYFDDELIRKDGLFVVDDLRPLNP